MPNKQRNNENGKKLQCVLARYRTIYPRDRLFTDELHRLAWGTDAGFYRLIPQIVIHSINDDEVIEIIYLADRYNIPVTFRAAGTSLSAKPLVTLF